MSRAQILAGFKVVEYGDFVSAPYAAKLLGDLGAEVVKVELPGGDSARRRGPFPGDIPHPERSGLFLYLNTNKLGITLNLETPTGRRLLDRLLEGADVFVHNVPPARACSLGLGYERLSAVNPGLIVVAISPYGQDGPYRDYKAYDVNTQAAGGLSLGIGEPGREPLKLPLTQSGFQAGLVGALAGLCALFGREATGRGQFIDVAEADVWATVHTGVGVVAWLFSGRLRQRSGRRLVGQPYPHGVFRCKDGHVALQCSERRQWERFLEMVGNPEWGRDPKYRDRLKNQEEYAEELDALLAPWLMARTREEIFRLCQEYRLAGAPLKRVDEVLTEPQLRERGFFYELDHPEAGRLTYPGLPFRFSEAAAGPPARAPRLGEHNEEIYIGRLGLTPAELTQLRQTGVV
jgi:crotonobetainyl-CoA:carnitine CoA-transferase CaiB-like acyl-CoA transferase